MRKIISLFITIIIACSINGLDNAFKSELPTFEETNIEDNIIENIQEEIIIEEKSDLSEEQIILEKEIKSSSDTEEKKKIESSESTSQNEKVDHQAEVKQEKSQAREETIRVQPSDEIKPEQNIIQKNEVETQKENVKKDTPWGSLGIIEYEYYHTPAHSWAELDFKISDYGSREATLNACKEYGNKYIAENSGGYFCDSVNSYSGDYLGEDIDFY